MKKNYRQLGFNLIELENPYLPLHLKCLAVGAPNPEKGSQSSAKKVVGEFYGAYKRFQNGKWYNLYVMYGRDFIQFGEKYKLYCLDKEEGFVYQIFRGHFLFAFNATEFLQLLKNASHRNWKNFTKNCVLLDEEELTKFLSLIAEDTELSSRKKLLAKEFALRLKKAGIFSQTSDPH